MNILIINLTRFGDLLQTQAAVNELEKKGARVSLVCLDNFLSAAYLLKNIEEVFPFAGGALVKRLKGDKHSIANGKILDFEFEEAGGWLRSLMQLDKFKKEIFSKFKPDLVINLTPALSARILARYLAEDAPVHGFIIDEHGFGVNTSPWAGILMGAKGLRQVSPFNIVDLFKMIALDSFKAAQEDSSKLEEIKSSDNNQEDKEVRVLSCLKEPDSSTLKLMKDLLSSLAPEDSKGYVAFQLGASAEFRKWPAKNFAEIGDRIWAEHKLCPILLGSEGELRLKNTYENHSQSPFISLMGKTNLKELAAVLSQSKLLLTNDTGTMHLAAGLDVPILSIFLSTAQAYDTGPYSINSCSVEGDIRCHPCSFGASCPHRFRCHQRVEVDAIYSIIKSFIKNNSFNEVRKEDYSQYKMRIWQTYMDDFGFMNLKSLNGHEKADRTVWNGVQRNFIIQKIFGDKNEYLIDNFTLSEEGKKSMLEDAKGIIMHFTLLSKQGEVLQHKFVKGFQEKFLQSWTDTAKLLSSSGWFASLSTLWKEENQGLSVDLNLTLKNISDYLNLINSILKAVK